MTAEAERGAHIDQALDAADGERGVSLERLREAAKQLREDGGS